jgi:hypothetical protein
MHFSSPSKRWHVPVSAHGSKQRFTHTAVGLSLLQSALVAQGAVHTPAAHSSGSEHSSLVEQIS